MKNAIFLLVLIFFHAGVNAQDIKGVIPVANSQSTGQEPVTRAVVVGISDYQSPNIPDLNFAHRDAKMFAEWLKSPSGGSVPAENITMLTDGQATQALTMAALYGLIDECLEGDLAIIYFSGHGDVERKTISQPGYLLCSNSPPQTYPAGGAINVRDIQEVVSTLSVQNKARIVVITDACHAGKLAGSEIGGPAVTAQALTQRFATEVKILSCQPNESSIEGTQWGGGRGVFSFHLLEGLTGLSDKNGDGVVTLFEIRRYLEDMVPAETLPELQTPMCIGDLQFPLAQVDAPALAYLLETKSETSSELGMIGDKRLRDGFLASRDSLTQANYRAFEDALEKKILLHPLGICANDFYLQLIQDEQIKPLHNLMRRNLAAALQDEVQQGLNALLDNDPFETNNWAYNPAKYNQYPAYLQRSMELLGESHYMYRTLLAKKLYFEGYNLARNIGAFEKQPALRDSFKLAAKAKFLESFRLEPEAAYTCHAIGNLYYYDTPLHTDSVVLWCSKAVELSPKWVTPYLEISNEYGNAQYDLQNSELWLLKAFAVHPQNYLVLERLSWLKQWQGKFDESIAISKEMIALKPDIFNAYSTLAQTLTFMKGEYLESEKYCLRSLELEPDQLWADAVLDFNYIKTRRADLVVERCKEKLGLPEKYSSLEKADLLSRIVAALVQLGRFEEAVRYCLQFDSLQSGLPFIQTALKTEEGRMYFLQGELDKAESTLRAALLLDPTIDGAWMTIWALLGEINASKGKAAEAEECFKKAVSLRYFPAEALRDEAFFRYGKFLLAQKRYVEAEAMFQEIKNIVPKSYFYGYGMALLAASRGKQTEALDWLEHALDHFWPDQGSILEEPLFKKIRKAERFKAMMEKNFNPL